MADHQVSTQLLHSFVIWIPFKNSFGFTAKFIVYILFYSFVAGFM